MNDRRSNILKVIQGHIERVLPGNWWKCIDDFRFSDSREWNLDYVLEVLLAGALTGCKTLRDVETLSELYAERIPDTTLHDIMVRLNPEGLRELVAKGVKQALREHELPRDEFPVRIVAIDGKYLYSTNKAVNECSEPISGGGQDKMFRHMALRAVYVSSETTLYLGQREIECKGAETKNFVPLLDHLFQLYGRCGLLEVISVDAGIVSKQNAQETRDRGLHYIMALKGSQPTLYALACSLLAQSTPICTRSEIYNGKDVTRTLYRVAASTVEGWKHLTEFWKEVTVSTEPGSNESSTDTRYFMTSLPLATLSNVQVLQAIRMHWGIENNANWCFDVNFQEDSAPWTSRAMVLVSYLRMIAYNILSRLKTRRLKAQRHRALRWKDLFKFVEHALCHARSIGEALGLATPAFLH